MALDFVLLSDQPPTRSVPMGVTDHMSLMDRAQPKSLFPLLHWLSDYYGDTVFVPGEIRALRAELAALERAGLEKLVESLDALASRALAVADGIEAIAD